MGAAPGPDPGRRGGQPSTACKFVFVGLADHAEPDTIRVTTGERWRTGVNETTNEPAAEVGGMTPARLAREILLGPDARQPARQSQSRRVESAVGIRLSHMASH